MVDTIYFLASCDSCRKIIKALPNTDRLHFHDIRQNPLTETEIDELATLAGSYEAIFSKKAQLYKTIGLKDRVLTEVDYKHYLSYHYTFLNRPVFVINNKIYIGNSPKNIVEVQKVLE